LSRLRCLLRQTRTVAMDIGCRDQRDRDDSDNASMLSHACHPGASTVDDGAVQAAVSDFPKNVGRCPKKMQVKPYLSCAMFLEQESNGQPDAARTRQSRCMKSSLWKDACHSSRKRKVST
jgi:hypothetical protein